VNVLMIAPQPFFEPRGTPISIKQRLQGLAALGHQVDLVTYPIGQAVAINGVRVCRAPAIPFITRVAIGPSWAKLLLDAVLFFTVVWKLLRQRFDVIHSHEEGAFMALVLAPFFNIPHLYDMHSSLPRQLANYRFGNWRPMVTLFQWLEGQVLRTARVVLTVGRDLEAYVIARQPEVNHLRLENVAGLVELPVDPHLVAEMRERLGLGQRLAIVYTGNLERYQGLDLLREGVRQLVTRYPRITVVVVGGQPEQVAAERDRARRCGLDEHFVFAGQVDQDNVSSYLAMADILVSPRTGGLSVPLKLYAYLQSGKPILATRIEAHTQLLTDDRAVLVDTTPDSLASGLERLIEDRTLRLALGERARAFARDNCAPGRFVARLNQAYLSIQHGRPISELAPEQGESAQGWT
jgi:glycosyltransferase involved in cell wall biosynthesis